MNENIKQLIEKEAEKQKKNINWCYFDAYSFDAADDLWDEAFTKGANFILSKWQEAERWRKVEEELPKDGALVLAKWEALDPEHTEIKVLSYSVELGFITADELGDYDEIGIRNYETAVRLYREIGVQTLVAERMGLDIATVNRYLQPNYQPYITKAKYMSDYIRDKDWFYGI